MMKEVIVSGITGTVSATTGIAPALIAALLVYVSLRLVKTALTPPPATPPVTSLWADIRQGDMTSEIVDK
jgi:hypothetical protein